MKNEGALSKRFFRHTGIYRSDVSSLLLNLGQSTAFRSGPGQALGRAGRTRPAHRRDEFRPAIPQRVARQQCPSPLHRHPQLKTIAAPNGIFYHRTVTFLLTVCLRLGDKLNQQYQRQKYHRHRQSFAFQLTLYIHRSVLFHGPHQTVLLFESSSCQCLRTRCVVCSLASCFRQHPSHSIHCRFYSYSHMS